MPAPRRVDRAWGRATKTARAEGEARADLPCRSDEGLSRAPPPPLGEDSEAEQAEAEEQQAGRFGSDYYAAVLNETYVLGFIAIVRTGCHKSAADSPIALQYAPINGVGNGLLSGVQNKDEARSAGAGSFAKGQNDIFVGIG